MTNNQRGFHSYPGKFPDTTRSTEQIERLPACHFGYGDSALLHHSSDYEIECDSLALIRLIFLWALGRLRLPASGLSYPAYGGFITYCHRGSSQ
jgi:hypothetical protein